MKTHENTGDSAGQELRAHELPGIDETFVRANWKYIRVHEQATTHEVRKDWHGYVFVDAITREILLGSGNRTERWVAAADFTRDRLEEIRQLRRDVSGVNRTLSNLGTLITERDEDCASSVRAWCSAARILARLEAQLAELMKGMK